MDSGANGDTSHSEGRIRVVGGNSEAQQAKTWLTDRSRTPARSVAEATKQLEQGLKDFEAESAAYVICAALAWTPATTPSGTSAG